MLCTAFACYNIYVIIPYAVSTKAIDFDGNDYSFVIQIITKSIKITKCLKFTEHLCFHFLCSNKEYLLRRKTLFSLT